MGLVGVVLPLQYQPEHYCGKGGGVGIYLALDSGVPEGVAEGVYQRSHHTARLYGNELCHIHLRPVLENKLTRQMGDSPEEEQDTGG